MLKQGWGGLRCASPGGATRRHGRNASRREEGRVWIKFSFIRSIVKSFSATEEWAISPEAIGNLAEGCEGALARDC